MKHCRKCGAQKADNDYYARQATCKECVKAAVRQNYRRNVDHYREYERTRASLPHRVKARAAYSETEQGRQRSNAAKAAYIERNAVVRKAHITADNAVRTGRLWKSPCCMAPNCFNTENIQGHHVNYDDPLSVVWLCASCHSRLHAEFNRNHTQGA